jgi:hypothetical protein
VLRAAGETETTQENIQDWLQPDEGDPGPNRTHSDLSRYVALLSDVETLYPLYTFRSKVLMMA